MIRVFAEVIVQVSIRFPDDRTMNLSKVSHLPLAAFLAVLIMVGMPALARLNPKPAEDPWLKLRPPLHPVAGTLVFEGKPVAGAVVTFVAQTAEEGREHLGVSATDQDGRFWLRTFSSHGDGAVAGRHLIKVEQLVPTGRMLSGDGVTSIMDIGTIPAWLTSEQAAESADSQRDSMTESMMYGGIFPGMPEVVNILPPRFADEKTSGLTAEVTVEGPNEFLIQLHAEPPLAVDHEAAGTGDAG
jgi:hypothetical protein